MTWFWESKPRKNKGNTAQFKAHGLLESCSVCLPKKSRQGDSLTSIYLYNLTKNLAAQSAHMNYAVLPKPYSRTPASATRLSRVLFDLAGAEGVVSSDAVLEAMEKAQKRDK